MDTFHFKAFNRTIVSHIDFPELSYLPPPIESDIHIQLGPVAPDGIASPSIRGAYCQANAQSHWLHVPEVARYLVTNGRDITVDPYPNANSASVRIFILENCFKALLRQQGLVVMEGVAIKHHDSAVLFIMPPGFGKSTLAALFSQRGYSILSDEICAITPAMTVLPAYRAIMLWGAIAEQLDISSELLYQQRPEVSKYRYYLGDQFHEQALPIRLMYHLDYHKKEMIVLEEVTPATANMKKLADSIPIINLTCPRWNFTMNQMGFLLRDAFATIEKDLNERIAYEQ